MSQSAWILTVAALSGAVGMWLMLPPASVRLRMAGAVLGVVALGLLASQVPGLGDWASSLVFYTLAAVTVVSAAAAVTLRNPIYCAIWFALSLLGTAGLLLLLGAQLLAAATVVVYAGAILVTFLFVLMLAQPGGRAAYDRVSWEAQTSAFAGAVLVAVLSITVTGVVTRPGRLQAPPDVDRSQGVLAEQHVAALGRQLFDRHWIAVEVAGILLLAALIGAAVIVGRTKGPLAGPSRDTPSQDTSDEDASGTEQQEPDPQGG